MRQLTDKRKAYGLIRSLRRIGLGNFVDQLVHEMAFYGLDGPGIAELGVELERLVGALDYFAPDDEELARAA